MFILLLQVIFLYNREFVVEFEYPRLACRNFDPYDFVVVEMEQHLGESSQTVAVGCHEHCVS